MFEQGLHTDVDARLQPEGTYRAARNLLFDGGSLVSELGTETLASLPESYSVRGSLLLEDGRLVLFLSDGTDSQIATLSGSTLTTVFSDAAISDKLTLGDYVEAESAKDHRGHQIVYFTDGVNPPRFIDLDDPFQGSGPVERFSLFPSMPSAPSFELLSISDNGGRLKAGVYFLALAYVDEDSTRTNYFYVSTPIAIGATSQDEYTTSRIIARVSGISTEFPYLRVAAIRGTEVRLLPDIPTSLASGGVLEIAYTGLERSLPRALEEVLVDRASYDTARTLRQSEDILYLGGLTKGSEVSYQPYANAIKVYLVEDTATVTSPFSSGDRPGYENPLAHARYKTFKRGEVYALYISWLLKDGSETRAYHIPGRAATGSETSAVDGGDAIYSEVSAFSGGKNFHFRSKKDATYALGYWENESETYPMVEDFLVMDAATGVVTGDLRGQPVRHHRIPDYAESRHIEDPNTDPYLRIVGFRLENVQLPEEMADHVIGYKVYYAQRTPGNRTIIGQGFGLQSLNAGINKFIPGYLENELLGGGSYSIAYNAFNFHTFDLARRIKEKREGVEFDQVAFLKRQYRWRTSVQVAELVSSENDLIKRVVGAAAAPTNISEITLPDVFSKTTLDNTEGATRVFVETENAIAVDPDDADYRNYVWDLCTFHKTLYAPFDQQTLVSTGYLHTDLDDLDSGPIFGGDTVIVWYRYTENISSFVGELPAYPAPYITDVVLEATDNVYLRRSGEEEWQIPDGYTGENRGIFVPDEWKYDVWYGYDEVYDQEATLKSAQTSRNYGERTSFSTRVIRSQKARLAPGENHYRIFLADDYYDLPSLRGDLVRLSLVGPVLVPHMERGPLRTRGREELVTGDFRAFLGSGDIFSIAPEEWISTPYGYGGLQSPRSALTTEYGYFFVDSAARKVFLLSDNLEEISTYGLEEYFQESLTGDELLGWDPAEKRVLLTHGTDTVSFDPVRKRWTSMHDYRPDAYLPALRDLITVKNGTVYTHHAGDPGAFYGEVFDVSLTLSFQAKDAFFLRHVTLDGEAEGAAVFTTIRASNSHQDTGTITATTFDPASAAGNLRSYGRKHTVTGFRTSSTDWRLRERLRDRYALITITRAQDDAARLRLYAITLNEPA